jgi:hypothetical protein
MDPLLKLADTTGKVFPGSTSAFGMADKGKSKGTGPSNLQIKARGADKINRESPAQLTKAGAMVHTPGGFSLGSLAGPLASLALPMAIPMVANALAPKDLPPPPPKQPPARPLQQQQQQQQPQEQRSPRPPPMPSHAMTMPGKTSAYQQTPVGWQRSPSPLDELPTFGPQRTLKEDAKPRLDVDHLQRYPDISHAI